MKKISIKITEETILADVEAAARVLEEDGAIRFPDEDSRNELFDSCVKLCSFAMRITAMDPSLTDYELFVVDEAELCGYIVPEE